MSVNEVLEIFNRNVKKAADVIVNAVEILASETDLEYLDEHKVNPIIMPISGPQ